MKRSNFKLLLLLIYSLVFAASSIFAQENEDCLMCHNDKQLIKTRGKLVVSLFVDEWKIKDSVHKNVKCTECHS